MFVQNYRFYHSFGLVSYSLNGVNSTSYISFMCFTTFFLLLLCVFDYTGLDLDLGLVGFDLGLARLGWSRSWSHCLMVSLTSLHSDVQSQHCQKSQTG